MLKTEKKEKMWHDIDWNFMSEEVMEMMELLLGTNFLGDLKVCMG